MYRDNEADDLAWNILPRNTAGVFYIARFGGTGAELLPVATDHVEVWPVRVTTPRRRRDELQHRADLHADLLGSRGAERGRDRRRPEHRRSLSQTSFAGLR